MKLSLGLRTAACALLLIDLASAGEPTISVHIDPPTVRIGQPFEVTIDCVHDIGAAPRFDELTLDEDWWESAPRRRATLALDDKPGRALTQLRFELVGIEAGEHELELPQGRISDLEEPLQVPVPAAKITITPELAEDEDVARDLVGFRAAPEDRPSAVSALLLVVGAALVGFGGLLSALLIARLRKRKLPVVSHEPSATELLAVFDPSDEQNAREAFALASRAVRETIDARIGEDLSGCTDEEWIERRASSEHVSSARLENARELLRSAERVKYGMQQPTRWAVDELLSSARAVIEGDVASEGIAPEGVATEGAASEGSSKPEQLA